MKRYTTFEEIDKDLKYLRLKSRIDKEEFKISVHLAKRTFRDTFSPINLIAGTLGSIIKKAFILKVVDSVIGITRKKEK